MRLTVVGANGHMGRELIKAVLAHDKVELGAAIVRQGSPFLGQDAGFLVGAGQTGITVSDDLEAGVAQSDGILDFTLPDASVKYAACAAQAGIAYVTGTTGFCAADEAKIAAAANRAAIVKSGNMSLGVNLLAELVKKAATALGADEFDIELAEMHHRRKVDAPSGTALLLGQAAAQGRDVALDDVKVSGRDGHSGPRETGTIGFSALRGGSVIGDHSVVFAGDNERVVLSHLAQDRKIFANGAIKAALWAQQQPSGLYSMRDVLGLK